VGLLKEKPNNNVHHTNLGAPTQSYSIFYVGCLKIGVDKFCGHNTKVPLPHGAKKENQ